MSGTTPEAFRGLLPTVRNMSFVPVQTLVRLSPSLLVIDIRCLPRAAVF